MRLTSRQKKIIRKAVKRYFGNDAVIWLFGSRVKDEKRGGDIDILVKPGKQINKDLFMRKIHAISAIKKEIGDRKIDLVIEHNEDRRTVVTKAHAEGMKL